LWNVGHALGVVSTPQEKAFHAAIEQDMKAHPEKSGVTCHPSTRCRSRGESRPWATKWPVSSLGAFLLAVVAGIGIFTYRNVEKWTPLQQWYWVEYLSTKSFPSARGD